LMRSRDVVGLVVVTGVVVVMAEASAGRFVVSWESEEVWVTRT
jgi:hypothetical protein